MNDWRQNEGVKAAQLAHEEAAAAVAKLEKNHRDALGQARAAELELARQEAAFAGGQATLGDVARARGGLAAAKRRGEDLMTGAEEVYGRLAAAETEYNRVAEAAMSKAWPAALAEYRRLAGELDSALEKAVDAEEQVEACHRALGEIFGTLTGGWITGPGGVRIGIAAFGIRRLRRAALAGWREWLEECGLADPAKRARKLAQDTGAKLRAMAGIS